MKKINLLIVISSMVLMAVESNSYKELANECKNRGDYQCYLNYTQKQLDYDLKKYSENSVEVAIDYTEIGIAYNSQGKYQKAFDYFYKKGSFKNC